MLRVWKTRVVNRSSELFMRNLVALIIPVILCAAPAQAEKRTFTIANNPDGYGIDRCLATGAPCGVAVATAYCRAREFEQVVSFRRLARDNDRAMAVSAQDCPNRQCENVVAIECSR
jgi:hypothetical protein